MNFCKIINYDTANGAGLRVTLFVSGCSHHCKGCFNPETWNRNFGKPFTKDIAEKIYELLKEPYIQGLTILGGEPMMPYNQEILVDFLREIKRTIPNKDIWVYSGFTFEELTGVTPSSGRCEWTDDFLSMIDVLVDGRFIIEQKDLTLQFRGSRNQRILNVPKSLLHGRPILARLLNYSEVY